MKMKKRVASLFLALALCLGLLPLSALAAEYGTVEVGGVALTNSADAPTVYATTDQSGKVTLGGSEDTYNIKWDGETLTLRNATILEAKEYEEKNNEKIAIYLASGDMNLALVGVNTVDAQGNGNAASYGINLGNGSLTIRGEEGASLSVFGGDTTKATKSNSCGIYANGAITINSGTVTVTGESASGDSYGIHAYNGKIIINGGTVNATSGEAKGDSCGIFAEASDYKYNNSVTINGGTVTATAGDAVGTGWYSCGIRSEGPITITGGTVNAMGKTSKAATSCGIFAVKTVTISGGTVTATGGTSDKEYSSGIFAANLKNLDVEVNIKNATVTATGGAAKDGSYGIVTETAGSGTSTVTINGNSVVWANMTGVEDVDGKPISGIVSNTTTINKENSIVFENGVGTVYGNVTLQEDLTVEADESLTIPQGATLTIPEDTTMTNNGTITNSGTLTNNGTLTIGQGGSLTGTVAGNQVQYTVTVLTDGSGSAFASEIYAAADDTVTITATPDSGYHFERWEVVSGGVTITGNQFTMPAQPVTVRAVFESNPYIPPTKTPSQQAIDKIEDARPGDTVKITLRTGQTKLDKEVFEELAGRDVTLEISLPGGVLWTVNGEDIPQTADLTDLDMGVSLNTSTIPVDVINAITGEIGTVQLTLKHDGPFGFTMTLTAPVGKENKGLWANLYHYDEDAGEMVYQTAALVDEDGNADLPFDHASQYAIVIDEKSHQLPFTDLGENRWFESAVAYAYRHDIMEGTSATTFVPNKSLTRAEAVQVLYNLEGQPKVSGNVSFPDLVYEWYKPAISWAEQTSVVDGYEDGTFRPDEPVTRQEFAQMLYNYAAYKDYDLTAQGDLNSFPDGDQVQKWALPAMAWANGSELINGHDDGTLEPGGTTTRAQAASILMRFDQNVVEN